MIVRKIVFYFISILPLRELQILIQHYCFKVEQS